MRSRGILAGVVAVALICAGSSQAAHASGLAQPEPQYTELHPSLDDAVLEEGIAAARSNPEVDVPRRGGETLALEGDGGTLEVSLPATGRGDKEGLTTVYDSRLPQTQVAVQPTSMGVRALVYLEDASAPEKFPFEMGGDVAALSIEADGSVTARDRHGDVVVSVETPWARDAAGRVVPTHFEIDGTTLIQVVEHRGGSWAYGITADPSWLDLGRCAAAISWVIGTTVFAAAKITKIRGVIKSLGGVRDTAKLLVGASTRSEKVRVLGGSLAGAASYFLGIDAIAEHC